MRGSLSAVVGGSWDPGWDEKWDDVLGRRRRPPLDAHRYLALCIAVASETASWIIWCALVYDNPHASTYIVRVAIGVLILLGGLLWTRTMLWLVGTWAAVGVGFVVAPPWPAESFVQLPFAFVALAAVIAVAPWRRTRTRDQDESRSWG
jgi:hypothetical protein